jgi:hypothetical protein
VELEETVPLCWNNGTLGAEDTSLSRLGAKSLAVGNGTQGDFTGGLKLTTLTFADSTSQTTAAGISNQGVVTGSRVLGSVYQNTTGKPMFVSVTAHTSNVTNANILAQTDSNSSPSTYVAYAALAQNGIDGQITFWVLPNNYYTVTVNVGTPGLSLWTEWY